MADWYKKLYVGKTANGKEKKIRHQIRRGRYMPGIYLVTLSFSEQDQLDIIEARYLAREKIRKTLPEIVGIACSYPEALEIVMQIATETYISTGDCDLRSYLKE